jgi:hypothetical protein
MWVGWKEFLVLESGGVVGFNKVSAEYGFPLRMKSRTVEKSVADSRSSNDPRAERESGRFLPSHNNLSKVSLYVLHHEESARCFTRRM